jgi:hypothetical protein
VLHLLERNPRNGAELMDDIDRMTMGWWRPSPGSIYPLLEQLEKEKLIEKAADGRFHLTAQARSGPEWMRGYGFPGSGGPRNPEEAVRELESFVTYLEEVAAADRSGVNEIKGRLRDVSQRLERLAGRGTASG